MALWIDPGGVINHKLCVITTSQTNRLQGRFETRMRVRSGGGGVLSIGANQSHRFALLNLGQSWHVVIISSRAAHFSPRVEPGRALYLSETGNPPRCGDMCMFNLLHSGSLDIYLSLWIWQNLNSSGMPVIKPYFQKVRLTHFLFKRATEMK